MICQICYLQCAKKLRIFSRAKTNAWNVWWTDVRLEDISHNDNHQPRLQTRWTTVMMIILKRIMIMT